MVMWWVMFYEIIPHVLISYSSINEKVFLFYPVLDPIKSHVRCLGPFLYKFSVDNVYGRGVVCFYWGWWLGKPSSWSIILRGTAFSPLWNSPPTSDSAADATTLLRVLHYVWLGPFACGRRFEDFSGSVVSELR